MGNASRLYVCSVGILAALVLGLAMPAMSQVAPLNKVGPATVMATQYGPDDKAIGKASELTDGNAGSRWLYRLSATPEKDLPLRVVFDMGVARTVEKVRIANYFTGNNFDRGFNKVDLFVGDALAPAKDGTPAVADVQLTVSDKTGAAWTEITLPKPVKGRCVTLRVQSNWGGNGYAANEVELYTVEADAPGAVQTPPTPATVQRQYKSYDYQETAENMLKQVRLTIPEGLTTVRGILVVGNGLSGDTRDGYKEVWYGEFLFLHDFAFLGAKGFTSHVESVQVMQHALQQFAKDANHPELVNVPYATTGFSAGGGFASRLLVEVPDRVIASVPVSSRLNFTGVTPNAAHQRTPACIITGETERTLPAVIDPVLAANRPQGALFGWMTIQGGGHTRTGQEVLAMPLLDAAVRLRYPADGDVRTGPLTLKTLDPDSGWVADNTTWKSGLTSIAPAKQFKGDLKQSSWLPTEDIAVIYRAYATYNKPLTITAPSAGTSGTRVWDEGSDLAITVDDTKFANWKKLELYDGAQKITEITQGPAQFTAKNLTAGYHVFSILGTDPQGNIRPSNPVLVVVRKLPAKG